MGIVYVLDYVINVGGVINVVDELYGYNRECVLKCVEFIYDMIVKVIEILKCDGIVIYVVVDCLVEECIVSLKNFCSIYLCNGYDIISCR